MRGTIGYDDLFVICNYCDRAVVMVLRNGRLNRMFPSSPALPGYLPSNVQRFFQQGLENLPTRTDAAGAMFRKALGTALKRRFPDDEKKAFKSLKGRIKEAADQGNLTPDLAEWAHEIRIGGNDAAHEEEPFSEKEAQDLRSFTELVLRYLFTLPGMLKEARERRQTGKSVPR